MRQRLVVFPSLAAMLIASACTMPAGVSVNQGTGTLIAGAFLPIVGNYGFHMMFLFWAGCTAVYFITAAFLLPETKGKSLEEIEGLFAHPGAPVRRQVAE